MDIEGYGNVNVELAFDAEAAAVFSDDAVDENVIRFGANTTFTAIEGLTLGAEAYYIDYDIESMMGFMVMGNKGISDNASGSLFLAYVDDEADKDPQFEVAAAILTTPTGNANFAINYEIKYVDSGDKEDVTGVAEVLISFRSPVSLLFCVNS